MIDPPSEWTVLSMLKWATDYFEKKGVRNPRFSIEWLLSYILEVKRLDLYLIFDRPLTKENLSGIKPLIKRRAAHEPLQYITGETDFLNIKVKVEPGVLIPRMETEQLVEGILEEHPEQKSLSVLDIGTGSGCIPVSIKKNRPSWKVYATDISNDALTIARSNAELNEAEIDFFRDDLFNSASFPAETRFDLIISNPPYIPYEEKEGLDSEVKDYEPSQALFCDSISFMYKAIHDFSLKHLEKEGWLYLEIHETKAEEIARIFSKGIWETEVRKDYDKKDRFLVSKKVK